MAIAGLLAFPACDSGGGDGNGGGGGGGGSNADATSDATDAEVRDVSDVSNSETGPESDAESAPLDARDANGAPDVSRDGTSSDGDTRQMADGSEGGDTEDGTSTSDGGGMEPDTSDVIDPAPPDTLSGDAGEMKESDCLDGFDNDNDRTTDCRDWGCRFSKKCQRQEPTLPVGGFTMGNIETPQSQSRYDTDNMDVTQISKGDKVQFSIWAPRGSELHPRLSLWKTGESQPLRRKKSVGSKITFTYTFSNPSGAGFFVGVDDFRNPLNIGNPPYGGPDFFYVIRADKVN
jgi:hypothetical protein